MSQPRNPQITCARSGPPPPSVTASGADALTPSAGRTPAPPRGASWSAGRGHCAIMYGSPCGTTKTSPASSRTGALAAKRRPASATPDDVIRHDVLGAGQHDRCEFRRGRDLVHPRRRHLHRKEHRAREPHGPQNIRQHIDVADSAAAVEGAGRRRAIGRQGAPGCRGRQRWTIGHGVRPRRDPTFAPSAAGDRRTHMTTGNAVRTMWALGDYHRFATATVWELGPVLVEACGVSAGQRVLDVAAGTGNVAIRAAQAGASVVASDMTPEHFDAGRRAAREAGVDARMDRRRRRSRCPSPMPSSMWSPRASARCSHPDHQAAASELLRVCRPGGVIGMMNFTPDGAGGDFFRAAFGVRPAGAARRAVAAAVGNGGSRTESVWRPDVVAGD